MRNKVAVAVAVFTFVAVVAFVVAFEARMGLALVRESTREAARGASLDALASAWREAREASESMDALTEESARLLQRLKAFDAEIDALASEVDRALAEGTVRAK